MTRVLSDSSLLSHSSSSPLNRVPCSFFQAPSPKPVVKLPYSLFSDLNPATSKLPAVLSALLALKDELGWRRLDLLNPSKKDKAIEFVVELQRRLKEKGLVPAVRVFLSPFVEGQYVQRVSRYQNANEK